MDGRREFVIDDMIISKEQMDELFGLTPMGSDGRPSEEYESIEDYIMVDDMKLTPDQWDQLKESQQEFAEDDHEYLLDDMILSKEQMDQLFAPSSSKSRNGVKDLTLLWPNKTVPVWISPDFSELIWVTKGFISRQLHEISKDPAQKMFILSALRLISGRSCVKFKILEPNFTESDYANVTSGPGCSSHVGYRPGETHVSLNEKVRLKAFFFLMPGHAWLVYLQGLSRQRQDSSRVSPLFGLLSYAHDCQQRRIRYDRLGQHRSGLVSWLTTLSKYLRFASKSFINFEPYADGLTMLGTRKYLSLVYSADNTQLLRLNSIRLRFSDALSTERFHEEWTEHNNPEKQNWIENNGNYLKELCCIQMLRVKMGI